MEFKELQAIFDSKPHVGYYVNKDDRMASLDHVTLISKVTDNLYVGGYEDGLDLGDFFTHVFSLFKWGKYPVAEGVVHSEIELLDSRSENRWEDVERIADEVTNALQDPSNKVLVHCQAGINRSNLVAGRALMNLGYSSDEAIDLLRRRRSELVLANKTFEDYLRGK